jgi:hypothetical protein
MSSSGYFLIIERGLENLIYALAKRSYPRSELTELQDLLAEATSRLGDIACEWDNASTEAGKP